MCETSRSRRALRVTALLLSPLWVCALYLLSFGPALWLYQHGITSIRTVVRVYRPVIILDHRFYGRGMYDYSRLWTEGAVWLDLNNELWPDRFSPP